MRILLKFMILIAAIVTTDSNYGNVHKPSKVPPPPSDPEGKKSDEDDIFYFFSLHDYNRDHKLDGHELALAFQGFEFYNGTEFEESMNLVELEEMIDHALHEDDINNDGMIDWPEYLASQQYHGDGVS